MRSSRRQSGPLPTSAQSRCPSPEWLTYVGVLWKGGGTLLLVVLLSACGGDNNNAEISSADSTSAQATDEATQQTAQAPEPDPLLVEVSSNFKMREDRRLEVYGDINLPDGTRLNVAIERLQSGERWRERIETRNNRYQTGPLGSGSGLPDGRYRLTVRSVPAIVQPLSVQAQIGETGNALEGELVTKAEHGLGHIIVYTAELLIGQETRRSRDQTGVEVVPSS